MRRARGCAVFPASPIAHNLPIARLQKSPSVGVHRQRLSRGVARVVLRAAHCLLPSSSGILAKNSCCASGYDALHRAPDGRSARLSRLHEGSVINARGAAASMAARMPGCPDLYHSSSGDGEAVVSCARDERRDRAALETKSSCAAQARSAILEHRAALDMGHDACTRGLIVLLSFSAYATHRDTHPHGSLPVT